MEFSRREQFQAVLVGMAVADAAAHGKIAALCRNAPTLPAVSPWAPALIQVARQLSSGANRVAVDAAVQDAAVQNDSELMQALIQVPILLRHVDDPVEPCFEIAAQLGLPNHNRVLTAQLHQLLQILLRHPQDQSLSMGLRTLEVWSAALPPQAALTRALRSVVQTAGDFRLAITTTVSLNSMLPLVLVGMICTALRGFATIPTTWRQALLPVQGSSWYADRWGLTDEMALRRIATNLWQVWAGL